MAIKISPRLTDPKAISKFARRIVKGTKFFRTPSERKAAVEGLKRALAKGDPTIAKALKGAGAAGALGTIGAGALATAALAIPAHEAGKFIGRKSVELRRKPRISARLKRRIALEKVRRAERIAKGRRLLKKRGK